MSIKKIEHYIVLVLIVVFFSWVGIANAELEITEVMYNSDGTDIDWIEVYNPDVTGVDLTGIKLLVSNSTSNHGINKYSGSQILNQNNYGVIVLTSQTSSFVSKWGSVGNLFTASFSLPNIKEGESAQIDINNGDKNLPINSVSYDISMGANGNGNSLQKINGDWKESIPTPGIANSSSTDSSEDNTVDENVETTPLIKEDSAIRKVTAKIITPKIIFAGIPFKINSLVTTNKKETLAVGNFKWNFGDGTVNQDISSNEFEHTYFYPGDYVISLEYCEHSGCFATDASDKINIKIVPSEILISSVGNSTDAFIEIENKSNYEIILSGWTITAGIHYFKIPDGTTLLANKKIKLSPRVTGFVGDDLKFITLTDSKGELATIFPVQKVKAPVTPASPNKYLGSSTTKIIEENSPTETSPIVDLNQLEASAGNIKRNISWSNYSYWGLGGIIIIGLASVLLLRKKKNSLDGIEKEIRAEDMTIIE